MQLRKSNIQRLSSVAHDVLIIGGGINGAVSAAALSGKGARTALIDRGDFAGETSMHSSNLAWGGIKYMETYEFGLVRKLCMSRNHLIRNYPSTVQEIRFLTTIGKGFRYHPVYLWLGGWLYWFIGNGFTRIPRLFSRARIKREESRIDISNAIGGFEYSDAYLHDNDARFVFGFVRSAMNRGCVAANYVESLGARFADGLWQVQARDVMSDTTHTIRARAIVNACGPWVDEHNALSGQQTSHRHTLSKGIHLIVPRIASAHRVLAFFADDGRLFFVIPMGARTCIGTTDTRVESPDVQATDEDIQFVLDNINDRLALDSPLTRDDIISMRWGVRPLATEVGAGGQKDFLQLSRKHAIDTDHAQRHISIFGGKLTDCLNVGDEICGLVRELGIELPHPDYVWYGEPPTAVRDEYFHQARLMDLDSLTSDSAHEPLSTRLWRRYGHGALALLEKIREDPRQADILIEGTEYTRCEIEQTAHREMITRLEDFLRRRSKISLVTREEVIHAAPGLREACRILFGDEAQQKFDEYFSDQAAERQERTRHNDGGTAADRNGPNSEALSWER